MDTKRRAMLLADYSKSVGDAYRDLTRQVKALRGQPLLTPIEFRKLLASMTGTCGAACSAATKRVMRAVVLDALEKAKASGLDITPTVAQHVAERLLGRGVDKLSTLGSFATPGRTAADKSKVSAADLVEIEGQIQGELASFAAAMVELKAHHAELYRAESKA
ncbi:hypothetical protein D3C75_515590 [compost metagenome]